MSSKDTKKPTKTEAEISDAEYNRKWDQESMLIPNRRANDPRFGEIHIFKKKNSNDIVFSKEKMSSNKQQAGKDIKELKLRMAVNRPNVQKLLGYSTSTRNELCSTSYFTQGFYEFPKSDLHKESLLRIQNGQSFTEPDLSSIASQALSGLNNLHNQKVTHGDIRPQFIGFRNENNDVIILDRLGDPSPIEKIQAAYIISGKTQLYLSPEMYKKIQGKDNLAQYDPFKNDVYALAMSILEVGNGQPIRGIYNTDGTIHQTKLDDHIKAFSQKYKGEFLNNFVKISLSKDQNKRHTAMELSDKLENWKETKNLSQSEPLSQTTHNKSETTAVQSSEPSSVGNYQNKEKASPKAQNTPTKNVENTPLVVQNEQSAPSFLKQNNPQETYNTESNNQQAYWQQPRQLQNQVQQSTPRQEQTTTLNSSNGYTFANPQNFSNNQSQVGNQPHDYATPFEYSSSLGSNQGHQTYSQQQSKMKETPKRNEYVPTRPQYTNVYSQTPVAREYISTQPYQSTFQTQVPTRTEYISNQPQYTTKYSQAPHLANEYINNPQYTTIPTQIPVRIEYNKDHAPTTFYSQIPLQTAFSHQNVNTTNINRPSLSNSNQVRYSNPVPGSENIRSVVFSNEINSPQNMIPRSQKDANYSNDEKWVNRDGQNMITKSERVLLNNQNTWNQPNTGRAEERRSANFINALNTKNPVVDSNNFRNQIDKNALNQSQKISDYQNVISYDEFLQLKKIDPSISLRETTAYKAQTSSNQEFNIPNVLNQNQYAQSTNQDSVSDTQNPVENPQSDQKNKNKKTEGQNDNVNQFQNQQEEIRQPEEEQKDRNQQNTHKSEFDYSNGRLLTQNFSSQAQSNDYQYDPATISVKRYRIENGNRIEISRTSFKN